MKKHEWLIVTLPLILVWSLDRITKQWAQSLEGIQSYGFVGFILHHNPGAMLGLFSDLPAVLRIVSLSTAGAFLVCIYILIQYLLPIKSLSLRSGLSVLLGGILGNVTDRILWGHVVDFIVIGNVDAMSPAFNVADALQWIGYALIVYAIVKEGDLLWPENNVRKKYWINLKFQLKYCLILTAMGLSLSFIAIVFSYTYLRVTMLEILGNNPVLLAKFLMPFVMTFSVVCIGFCIGLFTVGKIISHKIAGPIYAFEKFLDDTIQGQNRPFKLRSKDEFKHLEALALKIQKELKSYGVIPPQPNAEALPAEEAEIKGSDIAENLQKNS